ncbi:MAG: AraC family transcriptional regulator [Devosia sp.]
MLNDLLNHGPAVRIPKPGKGSVDLHSMSVGAGYEKRENETYSWEGRGRAPFCVIQHTIAGRGELDYAGVRHVLMPGDTMLLNFPHANRYWLAPGQRWEYFWIGVNGREALRITRSILDISGPVLRLGSGYIDRLAAVCRTLITRETQAGEASALAYDAVMALHDGVNQGEAADNRELPASIRRVLAYIEQHLGDRLDVERLVQIAGTSRAHFVRVFAATVGMPPSNYVIGRRLQLAQRLLTATDASIAEIASSCGFADGNYFTKVFRRQTRQTPTGFRLEHTLPLGGGDRGDINGL